LNNILEISEIVRDMVKNDSQRSFPRYFVEKRHNISRMWFLGRGRVSGLRMSLSVVGCACLKNLAVISAERKRLTEASLQEWMCKHIRS
jgi:hypothetical protein